MKYGFAKIWTFLLVTGSLAVLVLAGGLLFFGETVSFWLSGQADKQVHAASRGEDEVLSIAYAFAPADLSPVHFDSLTRNYLADIYEGLVRTDENLVIQPALALSWGMIDDYTWEFRLRSDARFHNGDLVTPADVKDSLDYARNGDGSQMKALLSSVTAVEVAGDDKVRITTTFPDPLLLKRLALTFVFPQGYRGFFEPVGTGPYAFVKRVKDDVTLKRFENYWGEKPAFATVLLRAIPERRARIDALERGEVQLLANLPPSVACSFQPEFRDAEGCLTMDTSRIDIRSLPNQEVSFLMFNVKHSFLNNAEVRKAISHIIDRNVFVDLVYGYARPATQLVSSGSFGYDPSIETFPYSLSFARESLAAHMGFGFDRVSLTFDYPRTLETLAQYIRDQFSQVGIDLILNPLNDNDLQKKISRGDSDLYYLGWRSELADALEVLQSVLHTKNSRKGYGGFNGSDYSNPSVDGLVESALQNLSAQERLSQIQEAMSIALEEDVMALPLFESETIFAFSKDITFQPRIDGYIHASEIR